MFPPIRAIAIISPSLYVFTEYILPDWPTRRTGAVVSANTLGKVWDPLTSLRLATFADDIDHGKMGVRFAEARLGTHQVTDGS